MRTDLLRIEIRNLSFRFPGSAEALFTIPEFTLKAAEKVFICGPSGCGKSTFLSLLSGFQLAPSESFKVCGLEINQLSQSRRDQLRADEMGVLFQQFNLLSYLSPVENVLLAGMFSSTRRKRAGATTAQRRSRAMDLLATMGVPDVSRRVATLSVGQQQRVAAARALYGKPSLLLCDEPTSALDEEHRNRFLELLFSEAERNQSALVFVSHDQSLRSRFNRVIDFQNWKTKTAPESLK